MVNFSYYYVMYLLPGFLTLALGLYAFLKNSREPVNRIFFYFTIAIFCRGLLGSLFMTSRNFVEAKYWDQLFTLSFFMIVGFFLHFCIVFYDRRRIRDPLTVLAVFALPMALTLMENSTNWFTLTYLRYPLGYFFVKGDYNLWAFLVILSYPLIGFWYLYRAYRLTNDQMVKRQGLLIFAGTLVPYVGGSVMDEILPMFGIVTLSVFLFGFFFYCACIFIAITRFRLAQITPDMAIGAIASAIPDALITTKTSGEIDYGNQLAEKLFSSDLVNKYVSDLRPTDPATGKLLDLAGQGTGNRRFEVNFSKPDGTTFLADISSSVTRYPDGRNLGVIWDIRDLSVDLTTKNALEGKKLELQSKIDELERLNDILKGRDEKLKELRLQLDLLKNR